MGGKILHTPKIITKYNYHKYLCAIHVIENIFNSNIEISVHLYMTPQ